MAPQNNSLESQRTYKALSMQGKEKSTFCLSTFFWGGGAEVSNIKTEKLAYLFGYQGNRLISWDTLIHQHLSDSIRRRIFSARIDVDVPSYPFKSTRATKRKTVNHDQKYAFPRCFPSGAPSERAPGTMAADRRPDVECFNIIPLPAYPSLSILFLPRA